MNFSEQKLAKEKLLKQKALSIWFTGLSGSGKTTLVQGVKKKLLEAGLLVAVLDADEIRHGLNSGLGYSLTDRLENIRRAAEVSKLFLENGVISLNAFICPTDEMRELAKKIVGAENFILVYLNAPIEICEKRDVKGMYAKARSGDIKEFTGINSPFEIPKNAHLTIDSASMGIEECVLAIVGFIKTFEKS